MTKNKTSRIICAAALVLAGLAACVAWADNEILPFTRQDGGSGSGCPGAYTGFAKMTNSTGMYWMTPPTNSTTGTLSDVSGFPPPYVSVVKVIRKSDQKSWCDTNSVSFPVTNTAQYSFTVYVKSQTPPPDTNQPMNVQITWQ